VGIEIPAGLQWVSYLAGEQWPKGDETAMFQLGDDWNGASGQLSGLIASVQQVQSQTASAVSGQTASAVAGQFESLLSGDSSIASLVSSMSALGSLATQTGTQIQYTKLQILTSLGIAAAEIAYALSSVEWTFGASLAWIPPVEAITMAVVRALVSQLVKRLLAALAETLTKTGIKALVKDAVVGAAVGTGISLVQDVAIQAYQVHEGVRSGIDWKQTLEVSVGAVVGGAVGSVAHGLLSKSLGESTNIGAKVLKGTVTHFGVGTVGNVAGAGAAGGGLDAEDIFGGAGGGAISGGVHGASKHPEGEAHGESSEEKSESTQASSTSDDDHEGLLSDKPLTSVNSSDPVSKPSISGDGPENLTNGNESPIGDNPTGSTSLEGGGVSSPALGASQASAGRGGETSTTDSSAPAAAASSSTGESSANQGESLSSDNGSGATGSGQQDERPAAALSDNQGAAAKSSSVAFGEAAPLGQQGSAAHGSLSDVAGPSRPAAVSSSGSTSEVGAPVSSSAAASVEGASHPAPAPGQPSQSSVGASAVARASLSRPPAVARTADNVAVQPARQPPADAVDSPHEGRQLSASPVDDTSGAAGMDPVSGVFDVVPVDDSATPEHTVQDGRGATSASESEPGPEGGLPEPPPDTSRVGAMPGPSTWHEFEAGDPERAQRIFDRATESVDPWGANETEEQLKAAYATLTPEQRTGSERSVELALVNRFETTHALGRLRGGSRHPDDAQLPDAINLESALAQVESVPPEHLSSPAVHWVAAVERGDVVPSADQAERFADRGIHVPSHVPTVRGRSNAEAGPSRHQDDINPTARTDGEAGHAIPRADPGAGHVQGALTGGDTRIVGDDQPPGRHDGLAHDEDDSSRPLSSLDVLEGLPPTDEMQARPAPHEGTGLHEETTGERPQGSRSVDVEDSVPNPVQHNDTSADQVPVPADQGSESAPLPVRSGSPIGPDVSTGDPGLPRVAARSADDQLSTLDASPDTVATETREPTTDLPVAQPIISEEGSALRAVVPVPADGWCLLYAVLVSTPPEHWPAGWGPSSDARTHHAAIIEQLTGDAGDGTGHVGDALNPAAGALHQMVLAWVEQIDPAHLPHDVIEPYRRSEEQMGDLDRVLPTLSEDDLLNRLTGAGVTDVEEPRWMSPDVLRQRYIEARVRQITREGDGSARPAGMSEEDAREHARSEVQLDDRARLTAHALGTRRQFEYLREADELPPLAQLDIDGLRTAVRETNVRRPLTTDEHEALVNAVRNWRPGTAHWNTSHGEMFPALVAHTLGVRLHNVMTDDVQDVGPESGPIVRLYYNGRDHYDGTVELAPVRPQPTTTSSHIADGDPSSHPSSPHPSGLGHDRSSLEAHIRRAVDLALPGRDIEEGTRPVRAGEAAGGGLAVARRGVVALGKATTIYKDISQHDDAAFMRLLREELNDPETGKTVLASLMDDLEDFKVLAEAHPRRVLSESQQTAYRVLRDSGGSITGKALGSARALSRDESLLNRALHFSLTAPALAAPYVVPILDNPRAFNFITLAAASETRALLRMAGMAGSSAYSGRLLRNTLFDLVLPWSVPGLTFLLPAVVPSLIKEQRAASWAVPSGLVQGAIFFGTGLPQVFPPALDGLISLGNYMGLPLPVTERRALANGEFRLLSQSDAPPAVDEALESQPLYLTQEGLTRAIAKIRSRFDTIETAQRMFEEQGGHISDNTARQLAFIRTDISHLEHLRAQLVDPPEGAGGTETRKPNVDFWPKLGYVATTGAIRGTAAVASLTNLLSASDVVPSFAFLMTRSVLELRDPNVTQRDAANTFRNFTPPGLVALLPNAANLRTHGRIFDSVHEAAPWIGYSVGANATWGNWTGERLTQGISGVIGVLQRHVPTVSDTVWSWLSRPSAPQGPQDTSGGHASPSTAQESQEAWGASGMPGGFSPEAGLPPASQTGTGPPERAPVVRAHQSTSTDPVSSSGSAPRTDAGVAPADDGPPRVDTRAQTDPSAAPPSVGAADQSGHRLPIDQPSDNVTAAEDDSHRDHHVGAEPAPETSPRQVHALAENTRPSIRRDSDTGRTTPQVGASSDELTTRADPHAPEPSPTAGDTENDVPEKTFGAGHKPDSSAAENRSTSAMPSTSGRRFEIPRRPPPKPPVGGGSPGRNTTDGIRFLAISTSRAPDESSRDVGAAPQAAHPDRPPSGTLPGSPVAETASLSTTRSAPADGPQTSLADQRSVADEALRLRNSDLNPAATGQTRLVDADAMRHPLDDAVQAVATARTNALWWKGLTEEQRRAVIVAYPDQVGNAEGLPPRVRDEANRRVLRDTLAREGANPRRLIKPIRRLDAVNSALRGAAMHMSRIDGGQPLVLAFDPPAFRHNGRILVSIGGDPYRASSVSWIVPGLGTTMANLAKRLKDGVNLLESARAEGAADPVSIVWIGYDAPSGWRTFRVVSSVAAQRGGEILHADIRAFNAGRDATAGDGSHFSNNHVFAHSYGSTTTGFAGRDGRLANEIRTLMLIGSPGVGAIRHADDFDIGPNVFVAGSSRDPVTTWGRTSDPSVWIGQGIDPTLHEFGARRVAAEFPRSMDLVATGGTHTSYYRHVDQMGPRSQSLTNFGRIVADWQDRLTERGHRVEGQPLLGIRRTYDPERDLESERRLWDPLRGRPKSSDVRRLAAAPDESQGAPADQVGAHVGESPQAQAPAVGSGNVSDVAGIEDSAVRQSAPYANPPSSGRSHSAELNATPQIRFGERVKKLQDRDIEVVHGRAAEIVDHAAQRHDAKATRLVVHVEAGGNGRRWPSRWPFNGRANAVGLKRAKETRIALEDEVRRLLTQRKVPQSMVTFREVSRGRGLPDNNGTAHDLESDDVARRVVVIRPAEAAPVSNRPLHIDFAEKNKDLGDVPKDELKPFIAHVVGEAARRHAAHEGGLVVHVQGGGNGENRFRGADAVGLSRARITREFLKTEVTRRLDDLQIDTDMVKFSKPTSRGRSLPDGVPITGSLGADAAARRIVVVKLEDAGGSGQRPLRTAPSSFIGDPPESSREEHLTVDFEENERSLVRPTKSIRDLAETLRGLANSHNVKVRVVGNGNNLFSLAGKDRATSVQRHLKDLTGSSTIKWRKTINWSGANVNRQRRVTIWWTASPKSSASMHPGKGKGRQLIDTSRRGSQDGHGEQEPDVAGRVERLRQALGGLDGRPNVSSSRPSPPLEERPSFLDLGDESPDKWPPGPNTDFLSPRRRRLRDVILREGLAEHEADDRANTEPRSFLDLSEDGDDESSEPRGGDVSTPAAARPGPVSFLDLSEDGDDESSEPRGGEVSTPAAARPEPRSFLDFDSPEFNDWPPGPDTDFLSPRGHPLGAEILREGLASHTEADDRADTEQPVRSQVQYVTVDFETRQRSLDSATPEMGALAQHLRRLADAGHEVEVWVEGGGARWWSSAGLNRATSVRRHLTELVGDAAIDWHRPTNRRTSSGTGPIKVGDDNRRQVVIWWEAKPAPVSEDHASDEVASVIPPGDHDGRSTQHTGGVEESDEIDTRHAAYQMIAPGLEHLVVRKRVTNDALDNPMHRHLIEFDRVDGELTDDAVQNYVDEVDLTQQRALEAVGARAGVTSHGIDDDTLRRLITPEQLDSNPELHTYLRRPDSTIRTDHRGEQIVEGVTHEGVQVTFRSSERDPLATTRKELVLEALSELKSAGHVLPDRLDVLLLRYHRELTLRAVLDEDGRTKLDIDSRKVDGDPVVGDVAAAFVPPGFLYLTPRVVATHTRILAELAGVDHDMENPGLGTILHEMFHWLHFHNRPALVADLASTEFLEEDRGAVGTVSPYALTNPHEFVAEFGLNRLLEEEDDDPDIAAWLEELYKGLCGPLPRSETSDREASVGGRARLSPEPSTVAAGLPVAWTLDSSVNASDRASHANVESGSRAT
jgi:hypothetical protein